jgi:opacity protein-like surface antigen
MKRFAIAAAMLTVFALPAAAADCAKDYKAFWDSFNTGPAKDLAGDKMAIVHRQALRAFDACSAGDETSAKSIFARLKDAAPAKGDDYWKSLSQSAPAKK